MVEAKRHPNLTDGTDADGTVLAASLAFVTFGDGTAGGLPAVDLAAASGPTSGQAVPAVAIPDTSVVPSVPSGAGAIAEPQLDAYTYGQTSVYGSNFSTAWRYSTGMGVVVGFVDDGFDPATTATFGNFSTALSLAFGTGSPTALGEPSGGFHGTTTAGMIGASGANNTPMGLAPNATIVGTKVDFNTATFDVLAQAEAYAASVSSIVNNSWGNIDYAVGQPTDPTYFGWYGAIETAVASDRGGLGAILTFAAGNERLIGGTLSLQPMTADYRVIAVAASDANGTVASYSDPGAALLVAAIGDSVAVVNTGGSGNSTESGTSYSSPTVAAIVALMLSINPRLGWRDVQEILADSGYMPAPSAAGFVTNGGAGWNGGGMHFSTDLGFGVVDAMVAVNLARAWTGVADSANIDTATMSASRSFNVGKNGTGSGTLVDTAAIRVQHVQVTVNATYLPTAWSRLVLISPDGTRSVLSNQAGSVNGVDETAGLSLSGDLLTSNAFWGEVGTGTWTLQVQDINGSSLGKVKGWSLTLIGDNAATVAAPLVYTPEFAALASGGRTVVIPGTARTIDLIALPNATSVNLNGGGGTIDGVAVTVGSGLVNANADGSTGSVALTGAASGGSALTGGDGTTILTGYGGDTIVAGLGTTTITTGAGGSTVTLSNTAASSVTIGSGGGDTIYAGLATVSVTVTGSRGDTIYDQSAQLTFINGGGASVLHKGTGSVTVRAGSGGGTYYAGTGGDSVLTAGAGAVTFYGVAQGDILTAAGAGTDLLVAGAGDETLSGGTSTGEITLLAGSGSDTMTAGRGTTTFVLGTGTSEITMGGISDIIQVVAGQAGGLNTVTGFRAGVDDLRMVGFSALARSNAVYTQRSDREGGTLLTFSGGTRIDLVGVARVTSGFFA